MKKILSIALIAMVAMVGVFANGASESSSDGSTTLTFAVWDYSQNTYLPALIPVLVVFLAFQRFFVEGIASSGLKG